MASEDATTIEALAGVLGGTQSLHTNSYDEALALPTEDAVRIALRTQQVIAHETGVVNTIDPLGGSYFIEALTDELERQAEYLGLAGRAPIVDVAVRRDRDTDPVRPVLLLPDRGHVAIDRLEVIGDVAIGKVLELAGQRAAARPRPAERLPVGPNRAAVDQLELADALERRQPRVGVFQDRLRGLAC